MNNMRNKILMTLALLLTAVTSAWAQTETPLVTIQASENSTFTSGSKTFDNIATVTITGNGYIDDSGWDNCTLTVTPADGVTITSVKFYGTSDGAVVEDTSSPFEAEIKYDSNISREVTKVNGTKAFDYGVKKIEVFGTAIDVKWDPATKTGTFKMPAFDVEIAPIYAPTAQWAKVENEDQLPTAVEGIIAGEAKDIVKAGTVAKVGSTENAQGTLMYLVTTTKEQPTSTEGFSATVPTGAALTGSYAEDQTVYVWYYIKGIDAAEGVTPTAENTFNDSEICATPLTVKLKANQFTLTLDPAPVKNITVTADTETKTPTTEGKTDIKMNSEVKVTANEGYKFRKVEAKKHEEVTYTLLSAATTEDVGKVVCAAGHLHTAKTAVPSGCTAVGILGKVTSTGHGLILALKDAKDQNWNTINGWEDASYAGTTLKLLPDDDARGTNLTSYTTLGETTVSNWAVAQKDDYEAIFINFGSTTRDNDGTTYDANVNAYFTGVGGTERDGSYWSATEYNASVARIFGKGCWDGGSKSSSFSVWPVLGF